jgi:hypothetical protein
MMNSDPNEFLAFQEKLIDARAAVLNIFLDNKIQLLGESTDFKLRCVQSRSIARLRLIIKSHSNTRIQFGQR